MHLTRRITILLLAAASVMWMLALPLSLSAADAATGAPEIDYARFAYVYHIESGTEMFVKNGDTKCYPAASVKLMTGLIAAEHLYTQRSRKVIVTAEELQGVRGNNIGLKVGEELTVGDLLAALITGNANDAAQVLAYEIAGGIEPFVKMMNARAVELGMNSTVYTNVTGLHDAAMVTTVRDTAKVALACYRNDTFLELSGEVRYVLAPTNINGSERRITNKNLFICDTIDDRYRNRYMLGLNAGSTPQAGHCVTAICDNGYYTYLCIVMGASSDADHIYSYVECSKLLDWAFEGYEYKTVLNRSEVIGEIPVTLSSKTDFVSALPERSVEMYLPTDIDVSSDMSRVVSFSVGSLSAPVPEGLEVGELRLFYRGELVDTVKLVTKYPVDRSELEYRKGQLKTLIKQPVFKISAAVLALLGVMYVLLVAFIRSRRARRRKSRDIIKR